MRVHEIVRGSLHAGHLGGAILLALKEAELGHISFLPTSTTKDQLIQDG